MSEDDRILIELSERPGGKRRRRAFEHFEDKLEAYSQTVVIWSLLDFAENKKYVKNEMKNKLV